MVTAWKRACSTGAVVLMLWPVTIFAQARNRYKWQTPSVGSIRNVGGDLSTSSSGAGGLKGAGSGAPIGALRSSLTSNYNLRRSGGATGTGTPGTSLPKLSGMRGQTYGSTKITPPATIDNPGRPRGTLTNTGRIVTASDIQPDPSSKMKRTTTTSTTKPQETKPITSFVPSEPSRYQKYMKQGEQAFRTERYVEAGDAFDVAIAMGRYLPESHLSMVHAYSAQGRYHSAAYHLRQALKHFPELPLVSLHVRSFYGRTETFVEQTDKLRQASQEPYADADLSLLLAYFRYFDGAEAEAAKALRRAWNIRKDNRSTTKAVETFWNGMVTIGKAKGTLVVVTKPVPTGLDKPAGNPPAMLPAASLEPTAAPTDSGISNQTTKKKNTQKKAGDKK